MKPIDDIVCRLARREDLPALLALVPQLERDPAADGARVPSLAEAEAIFAAMERGGSTFVFVAATPDEAALLATCTLTIALGFGHGGRPAATIETVVVAASHRGRGIGTRLLHHAVAFARERGCYKAQLITRGRPDQVAFYRRASFEWEGVGFKTYFAHLPAPD